MSAQPVTPQPETAPPMRPVEEQQKEAQTYLQRAQAFAVTTSDTRELAARRLVGLKTLIKEAQSIFDPIVEKAHAAHKEACTQRARVIEPLDTAARVLSHKIGEWDLAEQRRLQAEEAARLEAAWREAEAQREAEIERLEATGASVEEVQAVCDMPVTPAPVMIPPPAPRSSVSTRPNLKGRVTSMPLLVAHVAKNPQLLNLLDVNQSNLDKLCKVMGGAAKIPGVEIYNAAIVTARSVKGAR